MAEACGYRDRAESVNAIDSARKQKPYQKIQGTPDPAVEDLRKQIKNLTEILTKQEKPSASSQSDIDVLRAQVKTLTDLVLSKKDNKKLHLLQRTSTLLNLTRKSNVFIAKVWDIHVSTVTGLMLVMIALPTIPS